MQIIKNFPCPNREGYILSTDLYLPDEDGKYPLILMRTPYNKEGFTKEPLYDHYPDFVAAGYVVAVQDCRGTGASEGTMNLNGSNEHTDGYDAIEYLSQQEFCNGSIGMFGLSYFGFTQLAAASTTPPHLKAICPFMCCSLASFGTSSMQTIAAFHLGWAYNQLIEQADNYFSDPQFKERIIPVLEKNRAQLNEFSKILPMNENPAALLADVPMLRDYLDLVENVENKNFWDSIHSPISYDTIHTPMLCGTGWMDAACNATIDNFMAARASSNAYTRENAYLLIGPWTHGGTLPHQIETIDFGSDNSGESQNVAGIMLRVFNHYLKGTNDEILPNRVKFFVQGSNTWHLTSEWPPKESHLVTYYLSDNYILSKDLPEISEKTLIYDPMNPAPSGFVDTRNRMLMADWSEINTRNDLLHFSSTPLEGDCIIAGQIHVTLFAKTDVPDTDYVCRLTDIAPDGYERQITVGYIRARHRNGLFKNDFLTPDKIYSFHFPIGHAGYQIPASHKIGIQITGSMFPGINRNLNTIDPPALGTSYAIAHSKIQIGGKYASQIVLPILSCS